MKPIKKVTHAVDEARGRPAGVVTRIRFWLDERFVRGSCQNLNHWSSKQQVISTLRSPHRQRV